MTPGGGFLEWIELDGWFRATGQKFVGTAAQLGLHLGGLVRGGKVIHTIEVLPVRLETHLFQRIRTSVTTLYTPWGRYRWIPRPGTTGRRDD